MAPLASCVIFAFTFGHAFGQIDSEDDGRTCESGNCATEGQAMLQTRKTAVDVTKSPVLSDPKPAPGGNFIQKKASVELDHSDESHEADNKDEKIWRPRGRRTKRRKPSPTPAPPEPLPGWADPRTWNPSDFDGESGVGGPVGTEWADRYSFTGPPEGGFKYQFVKNKDGPEKDCMSIGAYPIFHAQGCWEAFVELGKTHSGLFDNYRYGSNSGTLKYSNADKCSNSYLYADWKIRIDEDQHCIDWPWNIRVEDEWEYPFGCGYRTTSYDLYQIIYFNRENADPSGTACMPPIGMSPPGYCSKYNSYSLCTMRDPAFSIQDALKFSEDSYHNGCPNSSYDLDDHLP